MFDFSSIDVLPSENTFLPTGHQLRYYAPLLNFVISWVFNSYSCHCKTESDLHLFGPGIIGQWPKEKHSPSPMSHLIRTWLISLNPFCKYIGIQTPLLTQTRYFLVWRQLVLDNLDGRFNRWRLAQVAAGLVLPQTLIIYPLNWLWDVSTQSLANK